MGGVSRQRPYIQLDTDYLTQDTVQDLGERYGARGPLALVALICETRKQGSAGGEAGYVAMRYRALARLCWSTPEEVAAIIVTAGQLGLVRVCESGADGFKVEMVKRHKWEAKDPTAAARKAASRARL